MKYSKLAALLAVGLALASCGDSDSSEERKNENTTTATSETVSESEENSGPTADEIRNICFSAYRNRVKELEESCGKLTFEDDRTNAEGVCFIDVRDLGGDGIEEMIAVYSEPDTRERKIELWGYSTKDGGKPGRVLESLAFSSDTDFAAVDLWQDKDGHIYIQSMKEYQGQWSLSTYYDNVVYGLTSPDIEYYNENFDRESGTAVFATFSGDMELTLADSYCLSWWEKNESVEQKLKDKVSSERQELGLE